MILFSGIRDPSGWQPGRAVGQAVHALWKRGRGRGEEEAGGQGLPIFNLDLFLKVNKSSQQQKTTRSSSTSRTSTTSTMQQVSTALEQIQVSLVASYGNLSLIMDHIIARKMNKVYFGCLQVQESRSQVTVALPRGRSRAQSLPR